MNLPTEIYATIFGYLDHIDLEVCSRICKRWKEVAHDERLWKNLCQKNIEEVNKIKGEWRKFYLEYASYFERSRF